MTLKLPCVLYTCTLILPMTRRPQSTCALYTSAHYNRDNTVDKLRHTKSLAYSVELVMLNKHQTSGGVAYLHCYQSIFANFTHSAACYFNYIGAVVIHFHVCLALKTFYKPFYINLKSSSIPTVSSRKIYFVACCGLVEQEWACLWEGSCASGRPTFAGAVWRGKCLAGSQCTAKRRQAQSFMVPHTA